MLLYLNKVFRFDSHNSWMALLFFALSMAVCFFAYSQGWSGGWHFDDAPNLRPLEQVFELGIINSEAAFDFVFSGDAGPLGRPLSLISFLVDGSAWPNHPYALLYTNSMLHAINGLLILGFFFNLGHIQKWSQNKSIWIASISAGLWLLLPISASSVLMAVQRMTVLSNSFIFLSLWIYLLARQNLERSSLKALLGMGLSLAFGTLLGVFTKEQAGILPILVWILESHWLTPPILSNYWQRRCWKIFRIVFFYIPAIAIAAYLIHVIWNSEVFYAAREFDIKQRLWTQAVILWDYLRLAFFPRATAFGPFHDDYHIHDGSSLLAWTAAMGWILFAILTFALRKNTRLPLLALSWFIVSHSIESTVVPLELYFEHRNYIALAIPIFALIVLIWHSVEQGNKSAASAWRCFILVVCLYMLIISVVLWQTTSLFGQSALAARVWYEKHPNSIRAAQFFAQNLVAVDNISGALLVLDATSQARPNSATLSLQGLQLACILNHPHSELENRISLALRELPLAPQRFSIIETLDKLNTLRKDKSCNGFIQREHLLEISRAALKNPRFSSIPQERSNLRVFMASLFMDAKELSPTMENLLAALDAVPSLQNLQITALVLQSAGIGKEMEEILDKYPPKLPRNPWIRKRMEKEWEELRNKVESQN